MSRFPSAPLVNPVGGNPWQFRLTHLFVLTTISAVAAALASAYGPGTLVLSLGILVAWLNLCGAFQSLQRGHQKAVTLWLAWTMFLISLGLPSIKVSGPVYGLWAAWFAYALPAESLLKLEPFRPALIVYFFINLANVLMLLMPLIIWRQSRERGQWLGVALCVAMPSVWCVAWSPKGLLVGYFVWCASYYVALLAIPVRLSLFVAMLGVAAVLSSIVLRWN
jgi:hypothetical protein